jgi:hypothetical protein
VLAAALLSKVSRKRADIAMPPREIAGHEAKADRIDASAEDDRDRRGADLLQWWTSGGAILEPFQLPSFT